MKPEDQAQAFELAEWERTQQRAILPKPVKESAKRCAAPGCGERIPAARRRAVPGVQFCIECQEWQEFMKGKHASSN